MRIIYVCGKCNKQFEGKKKSKTALERVQECERKHADTYEPVLKDHWYDVRIETYENKRES